MRLLHDYARGRFPRYGAGETAAALGASTAASSAASAAAGAGAGAAASAAAAATGGTLGINLAGGATAASLASANAAATIGAGIPSVLGATLSPGAVTALQALQSIGGGILTGAKTALPLTSAASSIKSGFDASKANKVAARQERRRSEAEASQSLQRARSVMAANDLSAAARGVVGGSGSQVALQGSNQRTAAAEMADITSDGNSRQALAGYARRRALTRGFARASTSMLDAFFKGTDFIGA